ncbi:head-specific guanylate cyclase isoform X2 [Neodiprion fabricii]|uniref:head-specific guanylate cyclase isoform X2 n=1 Tax=Neodiprion fabricii TaxID=2872261 RepID=UPI001ED927AE|nr:head-specific guanylate cyclase isoform X2 [Neodiprion fabricii]
MACPFSRRHVPATGCGDQEERRPGDHNHRTRPTRQSSVQITSFVGDDVDDQENTQTLNLKHLRAAVLVLTNPSNEAIATALGTVVRKEKLPQSTSTALNKLLDNPDTDVNYSLLQDIYETLNCSCDTDVNTFLDELGQELIATACVGILERAFRCLGDDLSTFLTTLDGVNDVVQHQSGSENEAEFVCTDNRGALELHFTTEHPPVAYLLVGSLKGIARQFYNDKADVRVLPDAYNSKFFRYRITPERYEKTAGNEPDDEEEDEEEEDDRDVVSGGFEPLSKHASDLMVGVTSFCKAFPWHFVVDRRLELVQLGAGFMRIFGHLFNRLGMDISTYFVFSRPRGVTISFHEILKRANTPFVLTLRKPPGVEKFAAEGLELKGQMVHCPESDSILFVSSPFLNGLEGLTGRGLFISDIPLHDATRDVILVGEQARAQDGLRRRMDKLKSSIEEANRAVDAEREKNVSLLHLIFPPDIAKRLWLGEPIEAKTYADVTMLFSDIVGFTAICSTATPMMVINMLQNIYEKFDIYCGQLDVYKMRIGIHTGTVLAGVVGKKMPRYCLFGHNVTLANKFESTSEPLRINVSPTTYPCLTERAGFILEPRTKDNLPKEIPASLPGTCHFLNGYKHGDVEDDAPLDDHVNAALEELGICNGT